MRRKPGGSRLEVALYVVSVGRKGLFGEVVGDYACTWTASLRGALESRGEGCEAVVGEASVRKGDRNWASNRMTPMLRELG